MGNHCRKWLDNGRIEGHWREPICCWIFARTEDEKEKNIFKLKNNESLQIEILAQV